MHNRRCDDPITNPAASRTQVDAMTLYIFTHFKTAYFCWLHFEIILIFKRTFGHWFLATCRLLLLHRHWLLNQNHALNHELTQWVDYSKTWWFSLKIIYIWWKVPHILNTQNVVYMCRMNWITVYGLCLRSRPSPFYAQWLLMNLLGFFRNILNCMYNPCDDAEL